MTNKQLKKKIIAHYRTGLRYRKEFLYNQIKRAKTDTTTRGLLAKIGWVTRRLKPLKE